MNRRHLLARVASSAAALALAGAAAAQSSYPDKPITMIVPFPPGGVADTVARPVAEAMAQAGRDVEKVVLARALRLLLDERIFLHGNRSVVLG